jgi:sialate O-acetylesterase
VNLPPTDASLDSYTIKVWSQDLTQQITLENVLFGDVFICGGQSNMEFTVSQGVNATDEILMADDYPNIRVFTVGQNNISSEPLQYFDSVEQPWAVASNLSIGGAEWTYFSAVCWFYAKNIYDTQTIPIGVVSSNWGGTIIQAWSSPEALSACPDAAGQSKSLATRQINPNQNSVLWNAMIVPLLPMRVRGAIWYQGEANIQQDYYSCMFTAMIQDWRMQWGLNAQQFVFYFVQLAPYTEGASFPGLPDTRLNQQLATELPFTGMATTIDLGDVNSPYGNIHPQNKQAVGLRLSLLARQQIYGDDYVIYSGPIPEIVTLYTAGPNVTLQITFQSQTIGDNIYLINNTCPSGVDMSQCGWYEIQASNKKWYNATLVQVSDDGQSLFVGADLVNPLLSVYGVRYGYNEWPVATLYNSDNLPAPPFYVTILSAPNEK